MNTHANTGVSGRSCGLRENQVLLYDSAGQRRVLTVRGPWCYARKCERPEKWGEIILTDWSRKRTTWLVILAVGKGCGRPRVVTDAEFKSGMSCGSADQLVPLMKVLLPDDGDDCSHPWGIKRSPYGPDEYFIHEDIIEAAIEE